MSNASGILDEARHKHLEWKYTGEPASPFSATYHEHALRVLLNDFPAEALYTIVIDDVEAGHLDDWPREWIRPDLSEIPSLRTEPQEHSSFGEIIGAVGALASRLFSIFPRGRVQRP